MLTWECHRPGYASTIVTPVISRGEVFLILMLDKNKCVCAPLAKFHYCANMLTLTCYVLKMCVPEKNELYDVQLENSGLVQQIFL